MNMNNSKSVVSPYLKDMYKLFFETDAVLEYALMHNQELCIYITSQPCITEQHWQRPSPLKVPT
jgi:hypothetical protein